MNQKLVFFIVRKYLRFDRTNPFISIIALLAFFGVAVGVMVLMIAMAIMNGTQKEFEDKLFTMNYPLSVYPTFDNYIDVSLLEALEKKFPHFIFSPYITTQAIIQSGDSMSGGVVYGIDKNKEEQINKIFAQASKNTTLDKFDIIVGAGIQEELFLKNGDKATLYFTDISPAGLSSMPKIKRFKISGSFKSGLHAYDKAYIYTSLESLQSILGVGPNFINGIHILSPNPMQDIKEVQSFINHPSVGVVGWWEQNGNFFAAMELERKALFVVLMLIILIASLNIISSLLMMTMSRRKEIALLLSLGASKEDVKNIFLFLGLVIGYGGLVFGVFLGFGGIYLLDTFDIISIPADVYGTSKLPLDLSVLDFVLIVAGSIIIVFFSSYYPAKKVTHINVLDVLRNE